MVNEGGIEANLEKIHDMLDLEPPKNLQKL